MCLPSYPFHCWAYLNPPLLYPFHSLFSSLSGPGREATYPPTMVPGCISPIYASLLPVRRCTSDHTCDPPVLYRRYMYTVRVAGMSLLAEGPQKVGMVSQNSEKRSKGGETVRKGGLYGAIP